MREKSNNSSTLEKQWWLEDEDDQYKHISAVIETIDQNSGWRLDEMLTHARYYLNRDIKALGPHGLAGSGMMGFSAFKSDTITNACKMAVGAITAKVAKQKPRIQYLTSEGNFDQQERGKNLTRYTDALFAKNQVFAEAQRGYPELCAFGTMIWKVVEAPEGGRVLIERKSITNFRIDEVEAFDGHPEQMHELGYIPRATLIKLFPKMREEIESCEQADLKDITVADRLVVRESYKLASIDGEQDGRRAITIANATLLSEPYQKRTFPYVWSKWDESLQGFHGESLLYDIIPLQNALNQIQNAIIDGQSLMAVPRWFVTENSLTDENELDDVIGRIVKHKPGMRPEVAIAPGASPELYAYEKTTLERIFEAAGVSMLSATSKKPAGLDSGKAMMVYSDIETDRFNIAGQNYQRMFVELADKAIEVSKEIFGNRKVKVALRDGEKYYSSAFWKDIDMDRDQFQITAFATNFLPKEPAGQTETVVEFAKAGMFRSHEEAWALLDYPDTGHFFRQATAKKRIADKMVSAILNHGKYITPERYMDSSTLQSIAQTALESYLDAKVSEDIPEERLEMLRTFMDQVDELMKNQQQPQEPPPAPAPGAPGTPTDAPGAPGTGYAQAPPGDQGEPPAAPPPPGLPQ